MRIGVDIDDVVADLNDAWLGRYNKKHGTKWRAHDLTQWEIWNDLGCSEDEIFSHLSPDIYDEVKPHLDVRQPLDLIRSLGHQVVFVTSCLTNGDAVAKLEWLCRHGLWSDKDQYIAVGAWSSYKTKNDANVEWLIDDHVKNCEEFDGYALLVRRQHNANLVTHIKRVHGLAGAAAVLRGHTAGVEAVKASKAMMVENSGWETDTSKGGVKYDTGKLRFDLIPVYPQSRVAEVYTVGSAKYDDDNWRKGMSVKRSIAALKRHLADFEAATHEGDLDPDSGCHHLASVVFYALNIMEAQLSTPEFDDRPSLKGYKVAAPLVALSLKAQAAMQRFLEKKRKAA